MAQRRKSSRRRRRRRSSRLPAIVFSAVVAVAAGYLFVRASDNGTNQGSSSISTVETGSPATDVSGPVDSGNTTDSTSRRSQPDPTDRSNLGKPVPVFSDTLGDLEIDQVLEDWTPVEAPHVVSTTAEIKPAWVSKGRITVDLPDGYYWGIPVSTFDEDERGVNFDIRQVFWGNDCIKRFGVGPDSCLNDYQVLDTPTPQVYPSFLGDLLYVSVAVIERPNSLPNVAVSPTTFWSLVAAGGPSSVTVPNGEPNPPNVALVGSPFLLTIVDGSIIAAEGVWIP